MTNEVTKQQEKPSTLKSLLTGNVLKEQIERALPKLCSSDRFLRVALTTFNKTPKLANCTQESFVSCLLSLAQLGLEPDGRLAHLIPYGNQCTLIIDYKGIAVLIMRAGNSSYLHADVVCENDEFEFNMGHIVKHKIDFKRPRGDMYAVYSVCKMKDGTEKHEVMSKEEVDKIRQRSKSSGSGPWVTDYNEMAKKTCFRRMAKMLDWSPSVRDALDKDDEHTYEPIEKEIRVVDKSLSRVEQMKHKYITQESTPIEVDQSTGEMDEFDLIKARIIDAKNKDSLWNELDYMRSSNFTEDQKKTLQGIADAKELQLDANPN